MKRRRVRPWVQAGRGWQCSRPRGIELEVVPFDGRFLWRAEDWSSGNPVKIGRGIAETVYRAARAARAAGEARDA
jgi:hypothetical protein